VIRLPPELAPSELLFLDDLPEFVDELLQSSRSLRLQGSWTEAEQETVDALEASQEAGAQVSRAAALIHLSDTHLATGRLGAAMTEARKGYRLFATQPSRYQRHNEAVAAYAIGLMHQSLGSRADALRWYRKADDLLERVKTDWIAINASSNASRCRRAQRWIRALCRALACDRTHAGADLGANIWLPVVLSDGDDESSFSLAQLEVERYVVAGTLKLAGKSFRIELLQGRPRPSLPVDAEYYALKVPSQALGLLGAREGDYALIVRRQDAPEEGPGVLETLSGPEFGRFKRDESGKVSFIRPDATVLGDDQIGEDLRAGYVTALLRQISG
jgi:tetratricopeptide (TPR) repeat protein